MWKIDGSLESLNLYRMLKKINCLNYANYLVLSKWKDRNIPNNFNNTSLKYEPTP